MSTDASQTFQPIYMSWATFDNIVDGFRASGLPTRIDRSVLRSRSGGDQAQFLRAASSFGFIEEDGTPTDEFRTYVSNPEQRPAIMREVLQRCYPEVVALPNDATPQMLAEAFRDMGADGETGRKAQTFYLAAARFAELPLSPHFKQTRPGSGGRKTGARRSSARKRDDGDNDAEKLPPDPYKGMDPAIVTLVKHLPQPPEDGGKAVFSTAERKAWFAYAKATFDLIYALPEGDSGEDPLGGSP